MASYKVIVGLDYSGKRAEPGDVVSDLPTKSIGWLTSQGIVEKIDGKPDQPKQEDPAPAPKPIREPQSPSFISEKGD